jgi:hypothetical protein
MFDLNAPGHSVAMYALLWPPPWEMEARREGWSLHVAGNMVEVDFWPPRGGSDEPIYHGLIQWLILNAYVIGDPMHTTAWEFEYAANASIYNDGRVPGDGMHLVMEEDGSTTWIDDAGDGGGWAR